MSDFAHKETDKIITKIEKELEIIYSKSIKEMTDKLEKTLVKINLETDQRKIYNLVMQEKRIQAMLKQMIEELNNANNLATKLFNDEFINVYSTNYNWEAYNIEHLTGYNLNFTIMNKNVVKEILKENANAFELMAIDDLKDKTQIITTLRRQLLQGLLQGESISKITKRIQIAAEKKRSDAIRIARTETNRVQNKARLNSMEYASSKGLKIKKQWISTMDNRTRHSHRDLDGEQRDLDDNFSNGCTCPGEGGSASEVINCRCTMTTEFIGLEKDAKELELDEELKKMSYKEWLDGK